MKVWRVQINSSVITFNLIAIIAAILTSAIGYFTDNQELIKTMVSPEAFGILTILQSLITIWLRSTNLQGKKPVEILPKQTE